MIHKQFSESCFDALEHLYGLIEAFILVSMRDKNLQDWINMYCAGGEL